ncbi:SURF1 family protein [Xenophilus sp. Marseille-Q4582]|uniref:SURF1 family protein n=1 Tax=Xenophilus sp. Marseille-Q4582 TaxID=2866600 RepID=UPI001CE49D06|nr:SURF1 family protein [Xenophilus sp. Marseille-Q4582]
MREIELTSDGTPKRPMGLRFWVITVAALALIALTVSLGRWQLARAAEKEARAARIEAQRAHPPLDWTGLQAVEDIRTEMDRLVRLRGLWVPTRTVYLDNRQMHGRPGFYVLTPFAVEGTEQTLMVQRGWVPRNFQDRMQLPEVQTPPGLVEITARIAPPPAQLFQLGKEEGAPPPAEADGQAPPSTDASSSPPAPSASDPAAAAAAPGASRIRQNLALDAFRVETGLPLRVDLSLQQVGPASEGLDREWPAPALGIEKHYGYAFQWFGLATLVTVLYVWFQLIAPRRRRG